MNKRKAGDLKNRAPLVPTWLLGLLAVCAAIGVILFSFNQFLRKGQTPNRVSQQEAQTDRHESSPERIATTNPPRTVASPMVLTKSPIEFVVEDEQQNLLSAIEEACTKFPTLAEVHHISGMAHAELLHTEPAEAAFRKALAVDPLHMSSSVELARVLIQRGAPEEASSILIPVAERGDSSVDVCLVLAEAFSQNGEIQRAAEVLLEGVNRYDQEQSLRLQLAQTQLQLNRFADAEAAARRVVEAGSAPRAAYIALSTALIRQGKREEALQVREAMPVDAKQDMVDDSGYRQSFRGFAAGIYGTLATVYFLHADWRSAEELLRRSLSLEPENVRSLAVLADLCRRTERTEDALSVRLRLAEVTPLDAMNLHNIASLAVSLGQIEIAEQALLQVTELDGTGNADFQMAQFYLGLSRLDEAFKFSVMATEKLASVDSYLLHFTIARAQGDMQSAARALAKARQLSPNDPRLTNLTL